jgi:2-polyprenyl-3-methyl-5-hydroxy-6-metoxy-1,4-benzoquinol methylase
MDLQKEKEVLEQISKRSLYAASVYPSSMDYAFELFCRFIRGESLLELGPAEGVMTERLASLGKRLAVVEGSATFCDSLRRRFPQIQVVHALFEEFEPRDRFDNIVLGHVLEHVDDPVAILRRAKSWLEHDGRILAAVPNCRSIHRQAAVLMGLLKAEDELNELDRHHGHRRVFSPESFRACFTQAGCQIEVFGGYWLKPLSQQQIEEHWTPSMIDAFMRLGERYPDIAAEMYVVAQAE